MPYESPVLTLISVKLDRALLYASGEAGDKNHFNDQGEF